MFEFKITLNDDDYLLFNQYDLLNSPSGKKSLMSFRFKVPFFCFMIFIIYCIAGSDFQSNLIEAIVIIILIILWIAYSKKKFLKSMEKRIKKIKKDGRLPYSNESELKFDDESIQEITPNTESKLKYSLIEKIAVTDKAIYIYFSSVEAFILPITAFAEEAEKQKFLEFISSKAGTLSDTK